MRKRAIVLGSTGSIGRSSLDVLANLADEWQVVGLAAGTRWTELAEQCNRFHPHAVALSDADHDRNLREELKYPAKVFAGPDSMVEMLDATACECVICAVVGAQGLAAALKAVEQGRRLALANKETLVIAGSLLMPMARKTGAQIIPVDSEHSAIFQAMHSGRTHEVCAVYLTASGGPFRTWSDDEMDDITLDDALRHPTWQMGPKVTIDSATMMNKAMEIVEARWLFDLLPEQIRVIVHPESIIHSLVEFCDGAMIAQLGSPDMRTPIQYALTYPARRPCPSPTLDLLNVGRLTLCVPNEKRFPALRLGHEVAGRGGTSGAVLNGANESAVELFRRGAIHYRDIARTTEQALRTHDFKPAPSLDELLAADRWAREEVSRCLVC